ncbi:MAG TPA: 3'-5' exonuclease [bacterium]|nr:3'-5' exonuclease [bacterium]HPT29430.1 3'-5' exonuclease [bacterium]
MKYLFFDTETTGLPKNYHLPHTETSNWPRMVQLAFILSEDGKILEQGEYIIIPRGFIIPDAAAQIHGIDTLRARREGVEIEEAIAHFQRLLENDEVTLVAHNFHFDKHILGAEFARLNIYPKFFDLPALCTMVSQTKFFGKYPKLTDLHFELFGRGFDNAHSALSDTLACHDCFFELKKRNRI